MFKVCKVTLVDSTANILSEYHDDVHIFFNGWGGQGIERNATSIRQGGATPNSMPAVGVIDPNINNINTSIGLPKSLYNIFFAASSFL